MNKEILIGLTLGVYFIAFIAYAIYKEKKLHKNKPKFKKDIK